MATRDALYWKLYKEVKAKHTDWPVSRIHAVAGQLRNKIPARAAATEKAQEN